MEHIYHLGTLIFILTEMTWIVSPRTKTEKSIKLSEAMKRNKGKEYAEWDDEYKDIFIYSGLPKLILTLWMIVGLLSYNWVAFLVIIVFNVAFIRPLSTLTKFSNAYIALHFINSIIGFAFGVFVLINAYHLRIDLLEFLMSIVR